MSLPSMTKIRHFLNHAPFGQRYPAWVIVCFLTSLISKALIYRLRTGGWDMNWADKFGESLFYGLFFGLYLVWPTRKEAGKNKRGEQQRS